MRLRAFRILLCAVGLCFYAVTAYAQDSLRQRQQAAETDRQELRKQINELQKRISSHEIQRDDIAKSLRNSEEKISRIGKTLHEYEVRNQSLQDSLESLNAASRDQNTLLTQQKQALAKQLKSQYASGLSPWSALLSGKNPQDISRKFSYLAYVLQERVDTVNKINATTNRLGELNQQITDSQAELLKLQQASAKERDELKKQQAVRAKELEKVKSSLQESQNRAQKLANRDKLLGELIQELDVQIKKADQAAKERQEKLRKQAAEKAAAEKAAKQRAVEQKAAEQKIVEQKAAQKKTEQVSRKPAKKLTVIPENGFPGLQKGLTPPVNGQVLGRFGAQRPEGGIWRGIVIRTAQDTNVYAVADGKVVYSAWLSGFGNLLILDHGQGYLSIYGYNKANIKDVGDLVAVGEVIAKVGATGGQVEPGLYFELRKDGTPINPQLWLKP